MQPLASHHHVSLTVSDLDRSAAWYAEVLGFHQLFREEAVDRRAAVMRFHPGGYSVGLVEHRSGTPQGFDPARLGLDHLAFSVSALDELSAWARTLDEHQIPHSGVIEIPPGAIVNFKDPDGIALALFWDRPPGSPAG